MSDNPLDMILGPDLTAALTGAGYVVVPTSEALLGPVVDDLIAAHASEIPWPFTKAEVKAKAMPYLVQFLEKWKPAP